MLSIDVGDVKSRDKFLKKIEIFQLAESLGSVESLVCIPYFMTHAAVPDETKLEMGITESLIRLSIGIEDIDRTLFNMFNEVLKIETTSKGVTKQVPVIFATGERFALTRRKNPIRDRNNANILPLISIVRQNLDIGPTQAGKKTAIALRAQPNYTIKRRLSEKDRDFQNLLNKEGLNNQDNVASVDNFIDKSNKTGSKLTFSSMVLQNSS